MTLLGKAQYMAPDKEGFVKIAPRYGELDENGVQVAMSEHMIRYEIMYVVNQVSKAIPKPSKAHIAAAERLFCYLAGTSDFDIPYKQGGLKLTTCMDANWRNNPDSE